MSKNYVAVLSLSYYPRRIAEAKRLLNVADQNPDDRIFPAVASLMVAVALEDGIRSIIADRCANADATGISRHHFRPIRAVSLRKRMTGLADIVRQDFFSSLKRSVQAKALHSLVTLRNDLLHLDEMVGTFDEHSDSMIVTGAAVKLTYEMPQDPWSKVSKEDSRHFGAAVDCYVNEVLDPLSDMSKYWTPTD